MALFKWLEAPDMLPCLDFAKLVCFGTSLNSLTILKLPSVVKIVSPNDSRLSLELCLAIFTVFFGLPLLLMFPVEIAFVFSAIIDFGHSMTLCRGTYRVLFIIPLAPFGI